MALAAYAKERLGASACVSRTGNIQGVCRSRRTARRGGDPRRPRAGRPSRLRARARLRGAGGRAARLRHREAHARPTSTGSRRCWRGRREADLREVAGRAGAPRALPRARPAGPGDPRGAPPRAAAAPARARRARARPPLHRALDAELRDRHRLLPARLVHDEAQPARQRAASSNLPGFRDLHPLPGGGGRPGRARADVAAPGDPRRGGRAPRGLAPAGRRLAGRADRPDADARLLRRSRRGGAAAQGRHPRHRARDEPGERDDGRLRARRTCRPTRAGTSTSRTCARRSTSETAGADADQPVDARALRRGHRGDHADLPRAPARSSTTTART